MFHLAVRKAGRERAWSLLVIGVLSAGLTAWIVVPSLGASLEAGVADYASRLATYIIVSPTGESPFGAAEEAAIPSQVVEQMKVLPGVEHVYPLVTNLTGFVYQNITMRVRTDEGIRNVTVGEVVMAGYSAVLGENEFPLSLVDLVRGRLPRPGEGGFIFNTSPLRNPKTGASYEVNDTVLMEIAGVRFNATLLGVNAFNPLLQLVMILWDPTFLRQQLGAAVYQTTFGGEGTNAVILKARSAEDVTRLVNQLKTLLKNYPRFLTTFDETTLRNLQALRLQTAPLYQLLGWVSLASTASVTFLVTYLAGGRRGWEAGLLISQGWGWRHTTGLFLAYYILLAGIAYLLSMLSAFLISVPLTFRYEAWGSEIMVSPSPQPLYLGSALPFALLISAAAAFFLTWRLRRLGLDTLLREY